MYEDHVYVHASRQQRGSIRMHRRIKDSGSAVLVQHKNEKLKHFGGLATPRHICQKDMMLGAMPGL